MVDFPHPLDPIAGGPLPSIPKTAAGFPAVGSEVGYGKILEVAGRLEKAIKIPKELRHVIKPAGMPGAVKEVLQSLASAGHQFEAMLLGNDALRVHLLHQGKRVSGAEFTMPLQRGPFVTGLPVWQRDVPRLAYQEQVKRGQFIARGRVYRTGAGWAEETWMQGVGKGIKPLIMVPAVDPGGLRGIAKGVRKFIGTEAFEGLVWAGAERGSLEAKGLAFMEMKDIYRRRGSLQDIFQAGVVGIYRGPGMGATPLIQAYEEGTWPHITVEGKAVFAPERTYKPVQELLKVIPEIQQAGINLSDRAIKAETAMAGNLARWKLGEIVPFGETGDPARQARQRWGIAQLAGGRGRGIPSVSTPVVEAGKRAMEQLTGRAGRWTTEARIALVLDPKFEQAVAGSAGGAVITRGLAKELGADITQFADYERAKWEGLIERGGGRAIIPAGVGTPLGTSLGTKHTVAAVRQLGGARMAIGWSTFLKGKTPEALREAVIRDIADQAGTYAKGYRPSKGGKFIRYSPEQLAARRGIITPFLKEVAGIIGGGTKLVSRVGAGGVTGIVPTLEIGPEATFDLTQLERISPELDLYNQKVRAARIANQKLNLREIQPGFRMGYLKTAAGPMWSAFVSASVTRRLDDPEVVLKAVGAWTQPTSDVPAIAKVMGGLPTRPGGVGTLYQTRGGAIRETVSQIYHPQGSKIRPKDVTNLHLWHIKEADQLADHYKKLIENWARFEKQEMARTVMPFFRGVELGEAGWPKIPGALTTLEMAKKYGHYQPTRGPAVRSIEEMAGTMWEKGSPLRKHGVAFKLPSDWAPIMLPIPGQQAGEILEGIPTRQIYLPALESYRGVRPEGALREAELGATDIYMGKIQRAHQELMLSVSTSQPSQKKVQEAANAYYNQMGVAFGGKTGIWSYLTTARMAHSGYFGLVPGGTGPAARAWKTAVDPYTAYISKQSARELGVLKMFGPKGERAVYGGVTRYPVTSTASHQVLLFKLAKKSELGRKQLRLSNLIALQLMGDFDWDRSSVVFETGREAQHLAKAMYEKGTLPRLKLYGEVLKDDPGLAAMLEDKEASSRKLAAALQETKKGGSILRYETVLAVAEEKTGAIRKRISGGLAEKYLTKSLTPAVNWYMEQIRKIAGSEEMMRAAGVADRTHMGLVSGITGLIEQQVSITKAGGISEHGKSIFAILGTRYTPGSAEYERAAGELSEALWRLSGAKQDIPDLIQKGFKSQGRFLTIADPSLRGPGARALLAAAGQRKKVIAEAGGRIPGFLQQLTTKLTTKVGLERGFAERMGAYLESEFQQYAAKGAEGLAGWATHVEKPVMEMLAFSKTMGLEAGTDIVGMAEWRKRLENAGQVVANESTKIEAAASRSTVLDRATSWWASRKTPYWQRAGVITGAAIILGAVAKNTLFPGYGPDEPPPSMPATPGSFIPPPHVPMAPPIRPEAGPFTPPEAYNLHKKPGGIWAYIGEQVGYDADSYDVDTGRPGMPHVKPAFGPRVTMPSVGLDLGPGIAASDNRPMILTGPPVGGDAPLPPAMARISRSEPNVPYTTPLAEPIARMDLPDYMTGGISVSALQPSQKAVDDALEAIVEMGVGSKIDVVSNRWDPEEGTVDRVAARSDAEYGSFA